MPHVGAIQITTDNTIYGGLGGAALGLATRRRKLRHAWQVFGLLEAGVGLRDGRIGVTVDVNRDWWGVL